jgi:hypothetical protein
MKALLLTIGALAAASSLIVGLNSALAATHSAGAAVKVANAGSGLGQVLSTGAAAPSICSRRTSTERAPAPGSAQPTGRH